MLAADGFKLVLVAFPALGCADDRTSGSLGGYLGSPTLAAYTAAKAFSRIFTEALWADCQSRGVDALHLNIRFRATPAMARLGMPIDLGERPETVAREGLENIANGPVWIVSTPGNVERARMISVVDDRGAIVKGARHPAARGNRQGSTRTEGAFLQ